MPSTDLCQLPSRSSPSLPLIASGLLAVFCSRSSVSSEEQIASPIHLSSYLPKHHPTPARNSQT
uniref:Uncharacterized protein n=1 Tax=Arundo donax TaxID=35708 RepID=A0A0A9DGT9_ARUDO